MVLQCYWYRYFVAFTPGSWSAEEYITAEKQILIDATAKLQ